VDHVLQVLQVKGRATLEALTAALPADPDGAADAVAGFVTAGLVEETRFGYKLTEPGCLRVDELYARERERAGPVIEDVYASFVPINHEVKQIVTDWQMRSVGGELAVNDHRDHRYDESVIARLRTTDAKVSTALAPLTTSLERFDVYQQRLAGALTRFCDGDHTMLAAPLVDSYHTVWFELHEELIILSGRNRAEEEAAS
jgi:pyruvate,orthophosphate dikinase